MQGLHPEDLNLLSCTVTISKIQLFTHVVDSNRISRPILIAFKKKSWENKCIFTNSLSRLLDPGVYLRS